MRIRHCLILVIAAVLLAGCGRSQPAYNAALLPVAGDAAQRWQLAERAHTEGAGNVLRVVTGLGLGAPEALEMAASSQGKLQYSGEILAGPAATAVFRVQFLSTQGTGRVYVAALDEQGNAIGSAGWLFTGTVPPVSPGQKWLDVRYQANYVGDWINYKINISEFLRQQAAADIVNRASRYRLVVESGEGQHALVAQAALVEDWSKALRITPLAAELEARLGTTLTAGVVVENTSRSAITGLKLEAVEPYGFGLIIQGEAAQVINSLKPGEKRQITWQVKAQRPHAVNVNKPWQLAFKANGAELPAAIRVNVHDERPGKIFYVMTEDLEPIDSAGYAAAWGNANSWIDPEELLVQMVSKAEALNAVAGKYGAKWTHYTALPVLKAAQWAASQSASGKWSEAISAVKQSIRRQAALGHEYAIHLHMDYDPELPGNVLSYNAEVDGFWANHLRHGWSHSILAEGDFSDPVSRTGSLYRYQAMADELSAGSPSGQLLTARVGSFDFGHSAESQAASVRAYRKAGLWATSDADGNVGGVTAGPYGREIYLTRPDTINLPAENLKNIGLVELRPTPQSFIMYDSQNAAEMNKRADEGIAYFTSGTTVKPGVHGIIGFTHAMFVMGAGDWRSLQGGQYSELDRHLAYLKTKYADAGLLAFGTANELVKAYLDYYSPTPVAVYGIRKNANYFYSDYEIEILGKDIPISPDRPQQVSMKYPLYLRDSAYRVSVLKNDKPVFSTFGLPTPYNDVVFTVDDRTAVYCLRVYHNPVIAQLLELWRSLKRKL